MKEDALPGGSDDALPDKESYSVEGRTNPSGTDPVAKIGGVGYATLQAAIDAYLAAGGDARRVEDLIQTSAE